MPTVTTFNAYRSGKIRREVLQGVEYVVVPATIIVPGVLNGSNGALYYPKNEVVRNAGIWNGTPIHVGHPFDPLTNLPVSGRDPEVLGRTGIGYVYNDRTTPAGERQCDLYLNVELTRNYDRQNGSDILYRAVHGQAIELSTGLFTDNELAHNGAMDDKGRPYDYIARNYRPDHLAVLPFERGACSVQDGCGVNVHNKQYAEERRAAMNPWKQFLDGMKRLIFNAETHENGKRIPNAEVQGAADRGWNHTSGHETPPAGDVDDDGEPNTFDGKKRTQGDRGKPADSGHTPFGAADQNRDGKGTQTAGDAVSFCPDCGKHMTAMNCSCGYSKTPTTNFATLGGMPNTPPSSMEAGMAGGKGLGVNPGNKRAVEFTGSGAAGEPIGVGLAGMTHANRNDDNGDGGDGDSEKTNFVRGNPWDDDDDNDENGEGGTRNSADQNAEGAAMLTANQRIEIVRDLCANCECWKGQDRVLNAMPNENLIRLKEIAIQERNNKLVADSVRNGLRIKDSAGKIVTVNAKTANGKLVVNAFGSDSAAPAKAEKGGADGHSYDAPTQTDGASVQAGGEEDESDVHASVKGDEVKAQDVAPGHTNNFAAIQRTPWFKSAPSAVQTMLLNQYRRDEQYRTKLANSLVPMTVNAKQRAKMVADYLRFDTPTLEQHAAILAGQGVTNQAGYVNEAAYGVVSPGTNEITENAQADNDVLPLPRMAW